MPKIIICDDARYVRVVLRKTLEEAGYEVVWEAASGEEAVEKYKELRPDAVILDIVLPQMDGIAAARQIKELDKDARIIMISAYGTRPKILKAIQAGARDFIVKPFQVERLIEAVNKVFTSDRGKKSEGEAEA
ncbi:MAG: response regulator [Planctomycetes bacterium]|nr:response regulator [Planctomycetota bacterium]